MAGFSTALENFVLSLFSMEGQPTMGALRFTFSMIFFIVLAKHDAVADSGRLGFICHPKTNDVHKEQCFSQYSAEMNPLMRLYHFLLVTALILVVLWIAMTRYSYIHLRKIKRVTDSREREHLWHEFRQIFLLHVCSEAVVLAAILSLFCFVQKIHFAETYICTLKIAPVITCIDMHRQVKLLFNILFMEGLAFLLFLCIVTACQAQYNKESFIKELIVLDARANKAVTPVRHMTWNFGVAQVPDVIHQDLENDISLDWKITAMSNESRERVGEEATAEVLGESLKEIKKQDLSVKVNTIFTSGVNYLLFQPDYQSIIGSVRVLLPLIMVCVSMRLYQTVYNERLETCYPPEYFIDPALLIPATPMLMIYFIAMDRRKIRKKTVCSKKEHLCYKFWEKYLLDVVCEVIVVACSLVFFFVTCTLRNASVEIVLTRRDIHHWYKADLNIVIIGGMTLSWLLCMWTICHAICIKEEFIKDLVDLTTGKEERKRWTHEENVVVMECYYKNKLYGDSEYIPTMRDLWIERGMPDLPKDRLRRQAHTILNNDLLREDELVRIRERVGFQEGKGKEERKRWTHKENVVVMECYYKSKMSGNSGNSGYSPRMHELWIRRGMPDLPKDRLRRQVHTILKNDLLPKDELKQIRDRVGFQEGKRQVHRMNCFIY